MTKPTTPWKAARKGKEREEEVTVHYVVTTETSIDVAEAAVLLKLDGIFFIKE